MEKQNGVADSPKGAESAKKDWTVAEIKKFIDRDLVAIAYLVDAIRQNPDTVEIIATFLHGRWMNAKHKEELQAQTELDLKSN